MKKHLNIYILFSLLVIFSIIIITGCSDSSIPKKYLTLSIIPEQDSIAVNENANFKVEIQDATELYGFHLEVGFDSINVELPDDFWSAGDYWSDYSYLQKSYVYADKFAVVVTLIEENKGISGNGTLFEFEVKGIEEGISELEILNNSFLYLIDKNGELIEEFDNITINNSYLTIN